MRFDGLDLNLLVVLDALMEERSVTGAAKRLNLSQSAASAAIARLRDYFGDDLFTMMGKRLVPTALAQSLETPTRDVLMRIRANLIARPRFDPATSTRRFHMVVSDYASIVLMHDVVRRVQTVAPGVGFTFMPFENYPDEKLLRGEVDFVIFPESNLAVDHPKQDLFSDDFCCVAWQKNTAIGDTITLAQYLDCGHIAASFGSTRRLSFEERALQSLGHDRRIDLVVQNFTMMAAMVVGTDRIATMHTRLAAIFTRWLPLKILKAPVAFPAFRESMQWPEPLDRDPAILWLRDIIADTADGLGPPPPV